MATRPEKALRSDERQAHRLILGKNRCTVDPEILTNLTLIMPTVPQVTDSQRCVLLPASAMTPSLTFACTR